MFVVTCNEMEMPCHTADIDQHLLYHHVFVFCGEYGKSFTSTTENALVMGRIYNERLDLIQHKDFKSFFQISI